MRKIHNYTNTKEFYTKCEINYKIFDKLYGSVVGNCDMAFNCCKTSTRFL